MPGAKSPLVVIAGPAVVLRLVECCDRGADCDLSMKPRAALRERRGAFMKTGCLFDYSRRPVFDIHSCESFR